MDSSQIIQLVEKMKRQKKINKDIVQIIDQMIIETACYQPVELLLRLNLLSYNHYEQWCTGIIPYLSDTLTEHSKQALNILDQASFYVRSLKLLAEPMNVYQWGKNNTTQALHFFPKKSAFANKLNIQYIRHDDTLQMDLFFDNPSVTIIKHLKQGLITRNIQSASQHIQALSQAEPNHKFFQPACDLLDALINALEQKKIPDHTQEMNFLLNELQPLAKKILSGQERDYMSFFWSRLAGQIDDNFYYEQKNEPNISLHSSFCYQQIPNWQKVISSIEKNKTIFTSLPTLSARHTLALAELGYDKRYQQALCNRCWQFTALPDELLLARNNLLQNHVNHFLDLDWDIIDFPTWWLIKESGLRINIKSNKFTPKSFQLLQKIMRLEHKEKQPAITLRKQLGHINNDVLAVYLTSIKSG